MLVSLTFSLIYPYQFTENMCRRRQRTIPKHMTAIQSKNHTHTHTHIIIYIYKTKEDIFCLFSILFKGSVMHQKSSIISSVSHPSSLFHAPSLVMFLYLTGKQNKKHISMTSTITRYLYYYYINMNTQTDTSTVADRHQQTPIHTNRHPPHTSRHRH